MTQESWVNCHKGEQLLVVQGGTQEDSQPEIPMPEEKDQK